MSADFPKFSLEQTLVVPNALQRNGGMPMTVIDVATAIGRSPGSSTTRQLGTASSAYGLTTGSYKTKFTMDTLGRSIVEPKSTEEHTASLVAAALHPGSFKAVFEALKGKKLPEAQFFANTLARDFDVDPKQAAAYVDIFIKNLRFVGLIKQTPGGDWISSDGVSSGQGPGVETATVDAPAVAGAGAIEIPSSFLAAPAEVEPPKPKTPNVIFIGHGKNKKPLEQLTKVLRELGIPHIVAEDEANENRAISKKIRDTMEKCGAAILIFSADEEYFDKDGNSVWKSSENVDHELGAASILYGDRVIMFKEESIQLASNFSGTGYISFEKDKLDAKTNELFRELIAMKILRVSVD